MQNTHYLKPLLEPLSVAVIGASEKEGAIGQVIFRNILGGGYKGKLWAVNPKYPQVLGQPCLASVEQIGVPVDLAIVTTAPRTIPQLIEQCGKAGIRYVTIVTNPSGAGSQTAERRIREAARHHGVRILGPKSLGLLRPSLSLNATFTETQPLVGELALVTQSGAMCAAVLDWATMNRIGVSSVVALGNTQDVDFGEVLDYLVHDEQTRYILLHVEKIGNARRFLSGLRSAARVKPVILFKSSDRVVSGLSDAGGPEAASMEDAVFDAAVRRAGAIRVSGISQLFHAARALAGGFRPRGKRLAVISNGTGPAAMAADSARAFGVPTAGLSGDTVAALRRVLPSDWRGVNPVDLGGDATPERYLQSIEAVCRDEGVDAILVILSPLAMAQPSVVARGIAALVASQRMPLCCCFMGGELIVEARKILEEAGVPIFRTPETVIELFHSISQYYDNQKLLLQTPAPDHGVDGPGGNNGRLLMDALLGEHRRIPSGVEVRSLLRTYGLDVQAAVVAHSAKEAMFLAEQVGMPVNMRVDFHDHDLGSTVLTTRHNLNSLESVRLAYQDLVEMAGKAAPGLPIDGVAIEPDRSRPHARKLTLSVFRDPVFGPVIGFGAGGEQMEVFQDRAVALPPLNRFLVRKLIESTRVSRTLGEYRQLPPVNEVALENALLSVSSLVCDLPWVRELAIDPLIVDENGVTVGAARMVIDHTLGTGKARYAHMAIHPYPAYLERTWSMRDGQTVTVRPIRPEDAGLTLDFFNRLSPESRYFRFMENLRELPPSLVNRFTQVDYDREMALIALVRADGAEQQVGSVRYTLTADGESVEFALVVGDGWQRSGLGRRLMGALIDCAREKSYRSMVGDVLADNQKMLRLMTSLGFSILPHPDSQEIKRVVRSLQE